MAVGQRFSQRQIAVCERVHVNNRTEYVSTTNTDADERNASEFQGVGSLVLAGFVRGIKSVHPHAVFVPRRDISIESRHALFMRNAPTGTADG